MAKSRKHITLLAAFKIIRKKNSSTKEERTLNILHIMETICYNQKIIWNNFLASAKGINTLVIYAQATIERVPSKGFSKLPFAILLLLQATWIFGFKGHSNLLANRSWKFVR